MEQTPLETSVPMPLDGNGKIDLSLMASLPLANLRRQTGIVLRSGAIRNLHDLIMCIGMGVDAVVPYLMFEVCAFGKGSCCGGAGSPHQECTQGVAFRR